MNKKTILLSLIFFQHISSLNAYTLDIKYWVIYLKGIEVARFICAEEDYLAQLNSKAPKISSDQGYWMRILDPYLYEFIQNNENHDSDIIEFKKLKRTFKHRPSKYKSKNNLLQKELEKVRNKKIEELQEWDKKLLEDGFIYNKIACINCIKIQEEVILQDINQLDQESKECFEKGSQLLDKICEKYPDKINEFKQKHEKRLTSLHNELMYQEHEPITNLVHELTTQQYQ